MVSAASKDLRETERENFILRKEVDTLHNSSILMKNQKQSNNKCFMTTKTDFAYTYE